MDIRPKISFERTVIGTRKVILAIEKKRTNKNTL